MSRKLAACVVLPLAVVTAPVEAAGGAAAGEPVRFDRRWLEPYFGAGATRPAAERLRLEDWAGAARGFRQALAGMPRTGAERNQARFALATALAGTKDWRAAGELFEALWAEYPVLAPYHAYQAARCRLLRGDAEGARTWAAKVPDDAMPAAEARLVDLDALVAQRRWAEVEAAAGRFLVRFPAGPRRAEALYRQAEALEALGTMATAARLYRQVWAEAPTEGWATRAEERLAVLGEAPAPEVAQQARTITAALWIRRGTDLFDRNRNVDAEATFGAALSAPDLDPTLACRARYHLAQSVWKQRQRARAAPLFTEAARACEAAQERDLLVRSLYQGGRSLANIGDRAGALAAYARLEADFPEHSYADDARLRSAEIAADDGDEAMTATLLEEIPRRYPTGDQAAEALWRLALRDLRAGNLPGALRWLDENLRLFPREDVWYAEGRALYWRARLLDKTGQRQAASQGYAECARRYPLSVYALLALERLRRVDTAARAALLAELRPGTVGAGAGDPWNFAPRPVFGEPGFRRAVELARLGQGGEARRELARLGFSAPATRDAARQEGTGPEGREDVLWITAALLDRARVWSASHAIPRYTLKDHRLDYPRGKAAAAWRIAYPRAFPELVRPHSQANRVPEALQLAIMREESAFNPKIESFANALGLTQMLVSTAQRFSTSRVTRDTLLDPARNVELGSRFLSFLLDRFRGAAPLAIAGYNAGEGAIDRWLRERGDVEIDEFIETIPYDETRNYTKRVLASYFAYAWLYQPAAPVPALSFETRPASPRAAGRSAGRSPARRPR